MSASTPDRLSDRLVQALVAHCEARGEIALVGLHEPPLTVITLPNRMAAVAVLDREYDAGPALRARIDRVLEAHRAGVLYLVLAGGGPDERAVLEEADRGAPDPNKLGMYHLDAGARLSRVCGRGLRLLDAVGPRVAGTTPFDAARLPALLAQAQRQHEDAVRFANALERRPQHVTRVLGAMCIVYFALSMYWGGDLRTLIAMGANSALLLRAGEVWRLLSHAFLHGGIMHLIVNLMALLGFGGLLEGLLGWRRFLILYGLAALAGGGLSAGLAGHPVSVGASGAIWGLMLAGLGLLYLPQPLLPRLIASRLRPRLLVVLGANGLFSLLPGIDLAAHAGGALVGFGLVATGLLTRGLPHPGSPPKDGSPPGPEGLGIRLGAAVMAAALVGSLAISLADGQPWRQPDRPAPREGTSASAPVEARPGA